MPSASVHEFTAELVVRRRDTPAEGVAVLDLGYPDDAELPRWQPGAHVDLILGDDLTRQYSLCGDPRDLTTWRIGVLLDPASRGGSQYVHDQLHVGSVVRVRGPRNHFAFVDAPEKLPGTASLLSESILTSVQDFGCHQHWKDGVK